MDPGRVRAAYLELNEEFFPAVTQNARQGPSTLESEQTALSSLASPTHLDPLVNSANERKRELNVSSSSNGDGSERGHTMTRKELSTGAGGGKIVLAPIASEAEQLAGQQLRLREESLSLQLSKMLKSGEGLKTISSFSPLLVSTPSTLGYASVAHASVVIYIQVALSFATIAVKKRQNFIAFNVLQIAPNIAMSVGVPTGP